jgi:N-formylglutamate amidohydrolase
VSWHITRGKGPIVATAIHAGHLLRPEILSCSALDEATRLREEDPYTDRWTEIAPNRITVETSRFEVDMNRPLEKSVYLHPQDAWGLTLWKTPLSEETLGASHDLWKIFYREAGAFLDEIHSEYGRFAVLDIHSYCHRRKGPLAQPGDPLSFPDVDVGTGSLNHRRWSGLVSRFMEELSSFKVQGSALIVGENTKFAGGHFPRWVNQRYGKDVCAFSIEFKKTFVDEWTGELDEERLDGLKAALASTLPGMLSTLHSLT